MNRQIRTTLSTLALAGLLLGSSAAQAEDGITRVATGVGRVIAAQGNAALATIREEIAEKLADSLKPFLPAESKPAARTTSHTQAQADAQIEPAA